MINMQDGYFEIKEVLDIDVKKIFKDIKINESMLVLDEVTKYVGKGSSSIKIIKKFASENDLYMLNKLCDFYYKNDKFNKVSEAESIIYKYKDKIKNTAEEQFGFKLEHDDLANELNLKSNYLNGRRPYFATDIHTDLLIDKEKNMKYIWSGHISNLLYLNNNYDGGELYFPEHEIRIKPEPGMLVSFPGNWYNRHAILPASDYRYAINMFLKISNFPDQPLYI